MITRLKHLPATLYRLAHNNRIHNGNGSSNELNSQIYEQVAGRLSELIADVRTVTVERDERRELLTLQVAGSDRTAHPARALSDGTLRFLALAVLEQVIINTHSPSVVMQVPDDSLLVAETEEYKRLRSTFNRVCFGCLPETWRDRIEDVRVVPKGRLLTYLNPVGDRDSDSAFDSGVLRHRRQGRRVVDRPDFQMVLPNLSGTR